METKDLSASELRNAIEDEVRKRNPSTEIWTGSHPKTGDFWIYRAAIRPEARIYSKTLRAEQEKADAGDKDLAFRVLIDSCVVWPPKAKDVGDWPAELTADGKITIDALLAMRPLIHSVIAGDICIASGFTDETNQKKL